ncbi:MAG TPA: GDSL-type esterase/lipase family protein, partial [Chloroflexota bacterium]|nr:GDSL-type esterase/lipase family protein [Chloroflexota bacterium]
MGIHDQFLRTCSTHGTDPPSLNGASDSADSAAVAVGLDLPPGTRHATPSLCLGARRRADAQNGRADQGNRSIDLLPRLERDVLVHQPDIVTLSIGVNDVWRALDSPGQGRDVSLEIYQRAIADVLDALVAAGAVPVVLTTSVIGEQLDSEGNRRLGACLRKFRINGQAAMGKGADGRVDADPAPPGGLGGARQVGNEGERRHRR